MHARRAKTPNLKVKLDRARAGDAVRVARSRAEGFEIDWVGRKGLGRGGVLWKR